ncbi:MAG: O-antigen ligase family protein [Patescibacteria group bacterium]
MGALKRIIVYLSYLAVFLLPWQTKLILRPSFSNYNEISLYVWESVLVILLLCFAVYKLKYGQIRWKLSIKGIGLPVYLLLAWNLFTLISIFFASDKLLAWNYYLLFILGIGLWLFFQDKGINLSRFKIVVGLLASLSLQAILAISQFLLQTTWACKYLGLSFHDSGLPGASVVESSFGRWLRAYGGFDHPNILGGVMVFVLLLSAYYIINLPDRGSKSRWRSSLFFWLAYFLGLSALLFSFSRAALLAYLAAMFIFAVFYITKKAWNNLAKLAALAFLSLVLCGALCFPFREIWFNRWQASGRLEEKSINERQTYLYQAANLIRQRPYFGIGRGNYVANLGDEESYPQPVHNVFILAWAEIGVFGFAAFALWLFYSLKKTSATEVGAGFIVALAVLMFFDHWLWSLPFGIIFFWLVLALIW